MTDAMLQAQIDSAMGYEELFVPALMAEWPPRVLDAAGVKAGHRVLDVACGTGVLARKAAARVGPPGAVCGLDPNPGMLAVARQIAPGVEWHEGTAESLPYPNGSFDAVVSQFGLMFFTDRRQALREMVRVLVPKGRLAVAVWDRLENAPAYATEVALLDEIAGKPAGDAIRAPFALGDREDLTRLFADAGMAGVEIRTEQGRGRFPSIRIMIEADLRGWLPIVGVVVSEDQISRILDAAEAALARYVQPDGTIEFESPAHIVIAQKP